VQFVRKNLRQEIDIDFINSEKPSLKSYISSNKAASIYRKNPSFGRSVVTNITREVSMSDFDKKSSP
jgi:hypothetical protein